ncbi:MAG: S1 RNA-binding domain-containing protein [Nanoarchaeota archaeon]|nr:S1 RNA-binding domain-containing protein [Nanoarchaeota archaeon]MBU1631727.1 S1 RNA-binding domain-containing protein [Nanoarchaeota archaeon]MBU1875870.1 S1 RNA-binding domain-containing protein [Nanoarchaeota archaeon]
MLYKRKGIPEEDEIVLCKVTKIFPNSVFVDLLEYNDSGMIHISEISPGRIRNLRDYVNVGRQIVCKVLKIDRERGHIDLSLRRVNSNQRREKLDEIKQELKAESLVKSVAKKIKTPVDEVYKNISKKIFEEYSHLYLCFKDVAGGEIDLVKLGIDDKIANELTTIILEKFKPSKISIKGEVKIITYASDGIEKIKSVLKQIEKVSPTINLFYLGAGRFKLMIEDLDYKPAEKNLNKVIEILNKFNDKLSTASFEREKSE